MKTLNLGFERLDSINEIRAHKRTAEIAMSAALTAFIQNTGVCPDKLEWQSRDVVVNGVPRGGVQVFITTVVKL